MKHVKDENKILKTEIMGKQTVIDKLERQNDKLKNDPVQQQTIIDLQTELKKAESKMRKLKEHRKIAKETKESMQKQIDDYRKDNESLVDQVTQMQEQGYAKRQESAKIKSQLTKAESELIELQQEVLTLHDQMNQIQNHNGAVERDLVSQLKRAQDRAQELEKYKDYGKMEKEGMASKIQELEQLVDSREDYILNLEREAVMLRKEIKDAKYNNEKNSYKDFVKNLTVLRPERGRSGPRVQNETSLSIERRSPLDIKRSLYKDKSAPQDSPKRPEPDYGIHRLPRHTFNVAQPAIMLSAQMSYNIQPVDKEKNERDNSVE